VFFRLWDEVLRQRLLRALETQDSLLKLLAGREVREGTGGRAACSCACAWSCVSG